MRGGEGGGGGESVAMSVVVGVSVAASSVVVGLSGSVLSSVVSRLFSPIGGMCGPTYSSGPNPSDSRILLHRPGHELARSWFRAFAHIQYEKQREKGKFASRVGGMDTLPRILAPKPWRRVRLPGSRLSFLGLEPTCLVPGRIKDTIKLCCAIVHRS